MISHDQTLRSEAQHEKCVKYEGRMEDLAKVSVKHSSTLYHFDTDDACDIAGYVWVIRFSHYDIASTSESLEEKYKADCDYVGKTIARIKTAVTGLKSTYEKVKDSLIDHEIYQETLTGWIEIIDPRGEELTARLTAIKVRLDELYAEAKVRLRLENENERLYAESQLRLSVERNLSAGVGSPDQTEAQSEISSDVLSVPIR